MSSFTTCESLVQLLAGNTVDTVQVCKVPNDFGLEVQGSTGDAIVDHLDSLAYRSYYLGRKTSIRNVSTLYFLHVDLHVLDQGQVNEGLCDGGQEWVAGDGERPLVDLEHKVCGAKLSGVAVRSLHYISGWGN